MDGPLWANRFLTASRDERMGATTSSTILLQTYVQFIEHQTFYNPFPILQINMRIIMEIHGESGEIEYILVHILMKKGFFDISLEKLQSYQNSTVI